VGNHYVVEFKPSCLTTNSQISEQSLATSQNATWQDNSPIYTQSCQLQERLGNCAQQLDQVAVQALEPTTANNIISNSETAAICAIQKAAFTIWMNGLITTWLLDSRRFTYTTIRMTQKCNVFLLSPPISCMVILITAKLASGAYGLWETWHLVL
jgi:hypothetical protein